MEKSGGVLEGEGECGDDVVWGRRDTRSLDILSVKKEAKLSASEIPGVEKGKRKAAEAADSKSRHYVSAQYPITFDKQLFFFVWPVNFCY